MWAWGLGLGSLGSCAWGLCSDDADVQTSKPTGAAAVTVQNWKADKGGDGRKDGKTAGTGEEQRT